MRGELESGHTLVRKCSLRVSKKTDNSLIYNYWESVVYYADSLDEKFVLEGIMSLWWYQSHRRLRKL